VTGNDAAINEAKSENFSGKTEYSHMNIILHPGDFVA
jgi:hypothetical protein